MLTHEFPDNELTQQHVELSRFALCSFQICKLILWLVLLSQPSSLNMLYLHTQELSLL